MIRPGPGWRDEQGMTLVELLVAILILGVVFAGVATFLVNSARIGLTNEQRVLSTGVVSQLQEEMQGAQWHELALYEEELDALEDMDVIEIEGLDLDADPPTYEGRDLAALPGPDNSTCPSDKPECGRRSAVPRPAGEVERDGQTYQVARLVSWIDRGIDDPDRVGDTKRVTTFVAWQVGGRWTVERFDSERAATEQELGDPTRARMPLYQVGPEESRLSASTGSGGQENIAPITVTSRFNMGLEPSRVQVSFYELGEDAEGDPEMQLVERTLEHTNPLSGESLFTGAETVINAGEHRFPIGTRPFTVTAETPQGQIIESTREIAFMPACVDDGDGGLEPDPEALAIGPIADPTGGGGMPDMPDCEAISDLPQPSEDVEITDVIRSPSETCVDADDLLEDTVTVTARIQGLSPEDYLVLMSYVADGRTRTEQLLPVGGDPNDIKSSSTDFTRTFSSGSDHGFRPPSDGDERTDFVISASREVDGQFDSASSSTLKVERC